MDKLHSTYPILLTYDGGEYFQRSCRRCHFAFLVWEDESDRCPFCNCPSSPGWFAGDSIDDMPVSNA